MVMPQGEQTPILKGGVKAFAGVNTFQDVIDKNPDFPSWSPQEKTELGDMFFREKYSDLSTDEYTEARTIFNKKYGVGQVSLTDNVADDPISKVAIPIHRAIDLATLGIPARAWDAANFGGTNSGELRDAQLSEYATDPGFAGDLYRLSQNGVVQGAAGMVGALKSTASMVANAGKSGLASLASTVGNNPVTRPFLQNAQKAAFSLGATGYSALSNALAAAQGKQNIQEGLASTALDVAAIPLGGQKRITNALMQGAAGGVGSLASDLIHGQPFNPKNAIEQALLQAGVGAAFPEAGNNNQNVRPTAQVRGLDRSQTIGVKAPGQPYNIRTEAGQTAERVRQAVQARLDQAARHQSVTEAKTQQARIAALKKQFEALSQLANNENAHPNVRRNAKAMQARILETHNALKAQYDQQFGKSSTPKAEKQSIEVGGKDFSNVVALVKDMRAKGNVKQANLMLNAFTPDTKARLYDEVHRQEQADKKAEAEQKRALQAKATISKPANGTPVGEVLVDALRAATEKPAGTATEYRAPGPDEYARMAKEARGKTAKASTDGKVIKGEVTKTEEAPKKGKTSNPDSKAAQEKAIREEITNTLDVLRQHNDWAEQPATDFLNRHDIDYKKLPNVGSVLHYGIFIPRKGMIAFKYNTPIGALLEKTGLPAMASKVKAKSGVDTIKSELKDLSMDSDVYTGDMQDMLTQAEQAGIDMMNARDAEENAYYARVEKAEARVKDALEKAQTADDLSNIFERLEGDEFAGMPPEFFDSMVAEYSRNMERIENAQGAGSAEPQRSPGQDSQNAGRDEGQTSQESQRFGQPTQKDLMPVEAMRQVVKEANAAGESVRIRYWAERSGETGEFHYKTLHDVKIRPGKNGRETKWNGINADGQTHTYIERNNAGSLKDSNIISVEKTGQPNEFKRVIDPETGQIAVEHVQSGEIIPQIAKEGVKSSTLHAKMNELITAVNDGKRVPVDRILDTAREFNAQKAVESQLEIMSQEERAKLYEAEMGEPC